MGLRDVLEWWQDDYDQDPAEVSVREAWGQRKRVGGFLGRNYVFNGGVAMSSTVPSAGLVMKAAGSIVVANNAVSYVERTYDGTVSTNLVGFTATQIPMAKVTAANGHITAVEDWRPIFGPFPYYDSTVGETGVVDVRFSRSDVRRWGLVGDGTDETTRLTNMLTSLYALNGGTVVFDECKTYRIDGQITLPNDGGVTPKQPSIRLTGRGAATHAGQAVPPLGGAQLDLRYNGASAAKILTLGLGCLELDHLTLMDGGVGSVPFLQTTNTTIKVHHNRFHGNPSKSGTSCDQDAIILGGTSAGAATGDPDSPFQGYGTVISDNCFSKIRRGVYGRTFCNATTVRDNWWLHDCGSNLAGGAAIEFLGHITNSCTGNVVTANQIEVGSYVYPIKLAYAQHTSLVFNSFYDESATTVAYIRIEATSGQTLLVDGYGSDAKPMLSDASATTTRITGHQSQRSLIPNGLIVGTEFKITGGSGPTIVDTASGLWEEATVTGAQPKRQVNYTPSGGALEAVAAFIRASATAKYFQLDGTADNRFQAPNGPLRVYAKGGETLWLGDSSVAWQITNGLLATSIAAGNQMFSLASKVNAITGSRGGSEAARTLLAALSTAGLITNTSVPGNTAVTYSASMTIDASTTDVASITATNNTAFTINAPTNPQANMKLRVRIRNTSGGALGVATWNAAFKMVGWVQPATGFSRSIDFDYDGTNWVEANRSAADVPN